MRIGYNGKRKRRKSDISVTWLSDAHKLREGSVRGYLRKDFKVFCRMSRRTINYWITQAKANYLAMELKRERTTS